MQCSTLKMLVIVRINIIRNPLIEDTKGAAGYLNYLWTNLIIPWNTYQQNSYRYSVLFIIVHIAHYLFDFGFTFSVWVRMWCQVIWRFLRIQTIWYSVNISTFETFLKWNRQMFICAYKYATRNNYSPCTWLHKNSFANNQNQWYRVIFFPIERHAHVHVYGWSCYNHFCTLWNCLEQYHPLY